MSLLSPSCLRADHREDGCAYKHFCCLVSVITKGSCSLLSCHFPKSELEVAQTYRCACSAQPTAQEENCLARTLRRLGCATGPRLENTCLQVNWVKIWPLVIIITNQAVNEEKKNLTLPSWPNFKKKIVQKGTHE